VPWYFTCPRCQAKNYGFRVAPEDAPGGGYDLFDDLTCVACRASGLYWVRSQQSATSLHKSDNVPLDKIAVGANQSHITWFDPQGNKEFSKPIVEMLKPMAVLDASFSQGERRKELLPGRNDVAEGLCKGLSLHWIRRVLQGGKTTYRVSGQKGTITRDDALVLDRLRRQVAAGANVQVLDSGKLDDQYLERLGFTKVKGSSNWTIPENLKTLWEETKTKSEYLKLWDKLATEYDSKALNVGGRKSKRPFSGVVAIKGTTRSTQDLALFCRNLCTDPEFTAGRAVFLSIGLQVGRGEAGGAISGHAIAVYYQGDSAYFLFDPNIGVFKSDTKANLQAALNKLIGEGWTTHLEWTLEGTYGYTVFGRSQSPAAAQPGEKPIVETASPPVTAIENSKLLPASLGPNKGASAGTPRGLAGNKSKAQPTTPPPSGGGGFRPQGQPQVVPKTGSVAARRAMFENKK
jgi:hypothetical protein